METLTPREPADTAPPEKARKRLTKGLFTNVALAFALAFFTAGAAVPFLIGGTALTVMTGSMAPELPPGHILIYHPVQAGDLKPEDVIAYQPAGNSTGGVPITHRVIEVGLVDGGVEQVIVQGDANPVPDRPVEPGQVIGKMSYYIPYAGLPRVAAFHSGLAWLPTLLSGTLIAGAGLLWVRDRRRSAAGC